MFELEQIRLGLSAYDEKLKEMGASLWRRWREGEDKRIRRAFRRPRFLEWSGKEPENIAEADSAEK